MKKEVSMFVAGAQKLKTERYALKALVHELNTRYNEKNIDVHIEMKSFEDFKYDQSEYDNYITQKADMVLFVMDGCVGDYTKKEFIIAVEAYKQKQIPEIVVFLKKYDEETEGIKEVQELLREGFGEKYYYVTYENEADLRRKAETRITCFISPEDHIHSIKKWRLTTFVLGFIASLLTGGLLLTLFVSGELYNKKPIVIFAGGGSVVSFIKDTTKDSVNIKDYPNSICMNLASGLAWSLLAEEAERTKNKEGGKREFVSICLSADEIDTLFFNEKTKGSFEKAGIVGYFLGEDSLVVYISNKLTEKLSIQLSNDTAITTKELAQIIQKTTTENNKGRIFTTSKDSGTLRLYQNCLSTNSNIRLDSMLVQEKTHLFYQNSRLDYINRLQHESILEYAILGSKHYRAENVPENNYKPYYVRNDSGCITKPMYVYFVAIKGEGGFKIKDTVIKFLEDIGAPDRLDKDTWHSIVKGRFVGNGLSEYITYINNKD